MADHAARRLLKAGDLDARWEADGVQRGGYVVVARLTGDDSARWCGLIHNTHLAAIRTEVVQIAGGAVAAGAGGLDLALLVPVDERLGICRCMRGTRPLVVEGSLGYSSFSRRALRAVRARGSGWADLRRIRLTRSCLGRLRRTGLPGARCQGEHEQQRAYQET